MSNPSMYYGDCGCTFDVSTPDSIYDSNECKMGGFLTRWLADLESQGKKRKGHDWFHVAMLIDLHFKDNCKDYRSIFGTLN